MLSELSHCFAKVGENFLSKQDIYINLSYILDYKSTYKLNYNELFLCLLYRLKY